VEYYKYTNELLNNTVSGSEVCDCHRDENLRSFGDVFENRYYRDHKNNFSITYLEYFGDAFALHGNYRPRAGVTFRSDMSAQDLLEPSPWSYANIQSMLAEYASKLVPAPSVLMLNAGHHRENYLDTAHRESVLATAKAHFPRFIWKTTNCPNIRLLAPVTVAPADALICATPGIECMNLNWTYFLSPQDFIDVVHFMPPIYSDVNIQFLHMLSGLQPVVYSALPASYFNSVVTVTDGIKRGHRYLVDRWGRMQAIPSPGADASNITSCVAEALFAQRKQHRRSTAWLEGYVSGPSLVRPDVCEGDLVRVATEKSIFLIQNATRREFASWQAFAGRGFDLDQVKVLADSSHFELYPWGDPLT
jgi:hypothetical protein